MSYRRLIATILGYTLSTLLALLLIPQVYKTYKLKHTQGLSGLFLVLNVIISVVGVVYSIFLDEIPLLVGEVMLFLASSFLLIMHCLYDNRLAAAAAEVEVAVEDTIEEV